MNQIFGSIRGSTKPRQLPVIEEAWNLPISAEMTARQQQQQQAQRQAMYAQQQKGSSASSASVPNAQYSGNGVSQNGVPATKRFKVRTTVLKLLILNFYSSLVEF